MLYTVLIYDRARALNEPGRRVHRVVNEARAKRYWRAAEACCVTRCVIRRGSFSRSYGQCEDADPFDHAKYPVVAFRSWQTSYSNFDHALV